jgi:hypothetical protein
MEDFNKNISLEERKEDLRRRALVAYDQNFRQSNEHMAQIVKDFLGEEGTYAMRLDAPEKREKLQSIFYNAARTTVAAFEEAFDADGNYKPLGEKAFWAACDNEGPIAKKSVAQAVEILGLAIDEKQINELLNNVLLEDAAKLSLDVLQRNVLLSNDEVEKTKSEITEWCKDPGHVRKILERVIPQTDYYYQRITRIEKVNDESILKFGNGASHSDDELKAIDIALRLANATWFAAQRHCAKKDGTIDRIDPDKRGGVFNTSDYRHIQQFQEARKAGLTPSEATLRIAFELCKDSWMLEG